MNFISKSCLVGALAALTACSGSGWKVQGSIDGANAGDKVALEGFNGASWFGIDSLEVSGSGSFSYKSEEGASHPDIYRLSYNGKTIYFPIDSIETVTVKANANAFDTDYSLSGSDIAVAMAQVDQLIAKSVADKGVSGALADAQLKRSLNETLLADSVGLISYYVINKTLGDKPLYDPEVRKDLNMIGAIANKFSLYFPNDPRTKYLETRYLGGRKKFMTEANVLEASELGLFEIELPDVKGVKRSLKATADNAGVTLLNFTSFDLESTVPLNVELKRLYDLFRANNLAIYQVSVDNDEVNWMRSAANLPWVAVRINDDNAAPIQNYNVSTVPVTFIINGNGDIVERVSDLTQLESLLRKHI